MPRISRAAKDLVSHTLRETVAVVYIAAIVYDPVSHNQMNLYSLYTTRSATVYVDGSSSDHASPD